MAASLGLIEVRILIFGFYLSSDFDWVRGRLDGLLMALISDSLVFNVAVPFENIIFIVDGTGDFTKSDQ